MQPSLPNPNAPQFSGEQPSYQPSNPEKSQATPKTSEVLPAQPLEQLRSIETHEQITGAGVADNAPPAAVAVTPTVTVPPVAVQDNNSGVVAGSNPATASDDDVIEKEWVNKSKKIIAATKGDPHLKEKEVSKLQADYMLKRYNKQVKVPDDA